MMRYPPSAPEPKVILGGEPAVEVPESDMAEKTPRPVYPDEVWAGTLFGEFADIVCRDNFIPKKFASESFRVLTGARPGTKFRAAWPECGCANILPELVSLKGEVFW